ncbi:MAG TPA: tetratricopeptide repeat protein [Solirubrobacterales bacterium]|nr:tetratricopeptide repeat protein [Solirubrobacterales bacterium]
MTRPTSKLTWILAPLLVFAGLLAVMAIDGSTREPLQVEPSAAAAPPASGDTAALIASLRQAVREEPGDAAALTALGDSYYQRLRETGDGSLADRAERAYRMALAADPGYVAALSGRATIALNDHRFADGLALARRAHRAGPQLVAPYAALVDGLIETGRYGEAAQTLQRMVALKPTQAAYLRVSYFRELHGDLGGAAGALQLAISAGAGTAEGSAYVHTIVGDLEAARGRYAGATRSYRQALAISPGFGAARAGLALLRAGSERPGDLTAAIRTLRGQVGDPPSPDALMTLGEVEQAAGRLAAARRHYSQASEIEARLLAAGGGYDAGVTLNEAEHGDSAQAVAYGRRAWRTAPSVSSADAYSWALYRDGRIAAAARLSEEAMRLGSRSPEFLYHAGMIARAHGDDARAARLLATLLEQAPRFSPLYAPRARQALRGLRGSLIG